VPLFPIIYGYPCSDVKKKDKKIKKGEFVSASASDFTAKSAFLGLAQL
jgi:hypothetical protein